jgi:PhnB protein
MEFYHSVFGGKLNVQTFKEAHASQDPSDDDLVMHAQLDGDNGLVLMASDPPARMEDESGVNCSLSLTGTDEVALRGYFEQLAEGGAISQPLEKATWGDTFGMCTDQFGVEWLVNISPETANAPQ